MGDQTPHNAEIVGKRDPVETALHTALWESGFRLSDRLEACTGQDARALAEALTPIVRGLMADAIHSAANADLSVCRFAAEGSLTECHKTRCTQRHPSPDEVVALVASRFRDLLAARAIFVRFPDDDEGADRG